MTNTREWNSFTGIAFMTPDLIEFPGNEIKDLIQAGDPLMQL